MINFLSDDWFAMVDEETDRAGALYLSPTMRKAHLNVELSDGSCGFYLKEGKIYKSKDPEANWTVVMTKDLLASLARDISPSLLLKSFINGEIKVYGDMSQILALQSAGVSNEQKQLFLKIISKTQFN